MAKKPKKSLDPFKIFQHASRFHESDRRLRGTFHPSNPYDIGIIVLPSSVLSVFASELYLKCLLCIERGTFPDTHNLKTLFKKLLPSTRRALEDLWDADVRLPHKRQVLAGFLACVEDAQRLRLPSAPSPRRGPAGLHREGASDAAAPSPPGV